MGAAEPETAALDEIIKGTGAALPGRTVPLATAPAEASVGVRGPIANPDAYDAYLRGLQGLNQRDEGGLQRAVAHFIIATRLAPTYLPALTGLAEALAARGFWEFDPPREAYPAARLMAMRAVELDHNFGEAHAVLGYVRLHHDWNRASAEGSLMRAVELNPSNPITRLWCVNLDVASGQFERALTQARQGLELDPFSRVLRMAPGWVRFFARDYDRAAEEVIAPFRQEPGFFHAHLTRAWALLASGRRADAADSFEAAAQLADFAPLGLLCEVHRHVLRDETEVARAAMRHLERLRGQQHVSAHVTALAHLGLGDHASALHWLGVAVEERSPWMAYMDVDPRLDALRSNPRFAAIRARATPLE
jgi:tetratricopeptide (TPR) repeat protein